MIKKQTVQKAGLAVDQEERDKKKKQVESRNLLSSFFVTLLIGLAYQEMIPPVRESVRTSGITFSTITLVSIFFFTTIRFFVGNQLHLLSESLAGMSGLVWLYDLMVIIVQCVLLTFMGGEITLSQNQDTKIGFVELLIALYVIDVAWIVSQWGIGKILPKWKRTFIPWVWGGLNTVLVILIFILGHFVKDIYSPFGLSWLLGINFIAFLVDIILIDYHGVI